MQMKKFLSVSIALFVFFAGCAKKPQQADNEFTQAPSVSQNSKPKDIFDEFYKEDNGASDSQNISGSKQTVSKAKSKSNKKQSFVNSQYSPKFSEDGSIVIQISTLRSKKMADDLAAKFNTKGYPSYVVTVQNPTPALTGSFFRVRIGAFKGIASAREFGENILKPDGYEYWIDKKSNDNIGIEGTGLGDPGKSSFTNPYAVQNTSTQNAPVNTAPVNNDVKPVSQQPGTSSPPAKSGTNEWSN